VLILTSVTAVFLCIFVYNYIYSREILLREVEESAHNLAAATVNRIDTVLASVEKIPQNLACFLETTTFTKDGLLNTLKTVVESNRDIYGAAVAFEPDMFKSGVARFAPYIYKSDRYIRYANLASGSYEYFYRDWYQIPKELGRPVWTEPYFDEGAGNIVMSTYSVPFYKEVEGERKLAGIVTADVSLSWLQGLVNAIRIKETGYGFLLSKNGTFVTHPLANLVMNETIFTIAEARKDPELRRIGREMIQGKTGFVPYRSLFTGKECWMVFAPLATNGWSLGVLFPLEELMAPVDSLNRTVLILGAVGFAVLFTVIVLISGTITGPLRGLAVAAADIARGRLDAPLPPIAARDEVGELTLSFRFMQRSLKQYIADLTETTAAKERIESELKIAHDIQMGMLPKVFPPFPDRRELDIFAALEPAREVGGDLYDFFFLDDNHLCFHVGDVSGKGVPASLFMAITNTLIKTKAARGLEPHVVLEMVNEDLSVDNPSCLFVTLFLGILDVTTGFLRYANGGHNPPFLLPAGGPPETLPGTDGIALGVEESFPYRSGGIALKPGDLLFLYTDGVTEAMNPEKAFFTEGRLKEDLSAVKDLPVKDVVRTVRERIKVFAGEEPQADDITMLAIRFNGSEG